MLKTQFKNKHIKCECCCRAHDAFEDRVQQHRDKSWYNSRRILRRNVCIWCLASL